MEERRSYERIACSNPVRYQRKGSQSYGNTVGRDISRGGIGIVSEEFFPVSTQLVFEIKHPNTQEHIKAVGEVMWVNNQRYSGKYDIGSRFLGPPLR